MRVLVVGRGGREHALCDKIWSSPLVSEVYVAPGNPGMSGVAKLVPFNERDQEELVSFAQGQDIDLVIVGPEQPLLDGLVDWLQEAGIRVFGPSKEAAEIEGSKAFAKDLMTRQGIPTAHYGVFHDYNQAKQYLDECPIPIVIKVDGLAAGKGVVVAQTRSEAEEALKVMLLEEKFGKASQQVVIEEFLEGEEFSLMALVHDELVIPLEVVQDHKRAYDGNQGPNTGGMGAYSPVPQIPSEVVDEAMTTILQPTVQALKSMGRPFTGVLYAGLILTSEGPKVIEFNARFGDPETQVLLPRLESDLIEVILALLEGKKPELTWNEQAVVGVVVASQGYPEINVPGTLLPKFQNQDDVRIYYSGVAEHYEGQLVSTGGRVFLVGGMGNTLQQAQERAYGFLAQHSMAGLFYRKDIAGHVMERAVSK